MLKVPELEKDRRTLMHFMLAEFSHKGVNLSRNEDGYVVDFVDFVDLVATV